MKANDACPDDALLRNLISDSLSPDASAELSEHIGHCVSCQQKLAVLESAPRVFAHLPKLKNRNNDSPQLNEAIEHAKSLRQTPPDNQAAAAPTDDQGNESDLTAFTRDGYVLLDVIGRGGMGIVYKARELSLDRVVAVKVMSPMLANDGPARERFLREARAAAKVIHPNVTTIHAVSEKPPVPYLVMEYVEGLTLQQQLDSEAGISIDNVVRIGRQICAGLAAAHSKSVVHRDIKPGNILLNAQTGKVLLSDFGLARAGDQSRLTRSGTLVGTPAYVAPEVLEDPECADHRADLFSLGVVLYATCSGDSPFQTDSLLGTLHRLSSWQPEPLCEKVPSVPPWLSEIVMRLLEKDPRARFQSAADVRDVLGRQATLQNATKPDASVAAEPTESDLPTLESVKVDTTVNPRVRTGKKRRQTKTGFYIAGVAASVLLTALLSFSFLRSDDSDDAATSEPSSKLGQQASLTEGANQNRTPNALIDGEPEKLSTKEAPFVCMDSSGKIIENFTTLEESVEQLQSGGQVEIRTNGIVEVNHCMNVGVEATIAAGRGFKPVVTFVPDDDEVFESMWQVDGRLTLQGIELRLPDGLDEEGEEEPILIGVEPAGWLKLIDCTLIVGGQGFCIGAQGNVSLEDCRLHAPESVVLAMDPPAESQTILRNCWLTGEAAIEVLAQHDHAILISDCTFACSQVISVYGEEDEPRGMLNIDARQSLFLSNEFSIVVAEDAEHDEQPFSWVGRDNVYSGQLMLDFDEDLPTQRSGLGELERWGQNVTESNARYVESPFNVALDELSDLIPNPNFRLWEIQKSKLISAGAKRH